MPIDRIYRRTPAGHEVLRSGAVGVAEGEHRRILGLIKSDTHFEVLLATLRDHTADDLHRWLADLEARGLIHSVSAGSKHDLDFTGSFNFSELRGTNRKQD